MPTYPPGTRIGQYEIASRPMMGGMGVVYFALDHGNDGRPVALKTFRPELLPDRAARDRFLREGTAWIELGSHPHIVRCYKVEYIDPTAFLVLELIAKEQNMPDASLRSWLIPGRPLPLEQALLFALQIARGMQYATEKIPGFVHRDLKPENILVGVDKLPGTNINRLRVTDFGLLKTISDSGISPTWESAEKLKPSQVQFTRGAGTPLYMAPEQWKGQPVGAFTDVYAMGCILYEMVSGQRAVEGQTIIQLKDAHCSGKLQPRPKFLPKDVDALLARCLVTNPSQRYGNWEELTSTIERVFSKQSGVSAPLVSVSTESNREERMQAGWSYMAMGVAYNDMGKPNAAVGYFEKALTIACGAGNRHGEGRALCNLGLAYTTLGDARRAMKYYEQCLIILREIGDRQGEDAVLCNLGLAYVAIGDARKAIEYCEQDLVITREIGDRRGEGLALGNLGISYRYLGDVVRAIGYFEQALAIARETGHQRGEGLALSNLGNAYLNLGDPRQATRYYEQSLKITREIGDRRGERDALGNLANTNLKLSDMRQAIGYCEQALVIDREIDDRRGESVDLGNLGSAYLNLGDTRQAISYFGLHLEIARAIGDRHGEGRALGNLGSAYLTLGDVQRGVEHCQQALAIDSEIGNMDGVATHSFNLALHYAQQGEVPRALPLAQEAARIWAQIGNTPNAQNAQRLVAELQKGRTEYSEEEHLKALNIAFEAFQRTRSFEEMKAVVAQYSFIANDKFIEAVVLMMRYQVQPEHKPAFEKRLAWLRQIVKDQQPGLLDRLFGRKG